MLTMNSSLVPRHAYSLPRTLIITCLLLIVVSWLTLVALEHIWPVVAQQVTNKKTIKDWNFSVSDMAELLKFLIPVAILFRAIFVHVALPIDFFLFSPKNTRIMRPISQGEPEVLPDDIKEDWQNLLVWALADSDEKRWGNPWRGPRQGELDDFSKTYGARINETNRRKLVRELANSLEMIGQQPATKPSGWPFKKLLNNFPKLFDTYRRTCIWKPLKDRYVAWDVGTVPTEEGDRVISRITKWRPRRPSMLILEEPSAQYEKKIELAIDQGAPFYRYPVRLLVLPQLHRDAFPAPTFKIVKTRIDQLLLEITQALTEGPVRRVAVYGLPGIGKSTFARSIKAAASDSTPHRQLFDYFGNQPPFLCQLGKDADWQKVLRILQDWAKSLGVSDDAIEECCKGDIGTREYRLQRMRELVAHALRRKKILIVVDDVWRSDVANSLKFSTSDPDSDLAYIFTMRESGLAFELAEKNFAMPLLTEEDTLQFFKENLPSLFENDREKMLKKMRDVATLLGGLPKSLELVAWSLRNLYESGGMDEVYQFLDDFEHRKTRVGTEALDSEGQRLSLTDIISTSFDNLNAEVRNDLLTLSILRPDPELIPLDLAAELLGPAAADKLTKLEKTGLLKRIEDQKPRKASQDKNGPVKQVKRYTMHRSISDFLIEHEGNVAELTAAAYEKAARYYERHFDNLDQQQKLSDSDYHRWYRYEDTLWLSALDNWRYYTMCQKEGYEKAAFKFTEEWFSAFWWWGTFTRSPVCDKLLANWPEVSGDAQIAKEDRLDLIDFEDAYPTENVEERSHPKEEWKKVQRHLERILQRRGIDHRGIICHKEQAFLYGLLKIFLAESHRFGDGDPEKAEFDYRSAIMLLERSSDERSSQWLCAWARFHLGDFLLETARDDDGMAILLEEVLPAAKQMRDHELWALVELDCGELEGKGGIYHKATNRYQSAVRLAYCFQIDAGRGITLQPDEYTTKFYSKTIRRVARNLIASLEVSEEASISSCQELAALSNRMPIQHDDLYNLLASKDANALASALFPAEFLEPVDGTPPDIAYANYAQEVERQLELLARRSTSAGDLDRV